MNRGASMDAISLDDWELLLPDHKSSFLMDDAEFSNGSHGVVGGKDQLLLGAQLVVIDMDHFGPMSSHPPPPPPNDYCTLDEEAKKRLPSEGAYGGDPIADDKDIDIMAVEPEWEELVSVANEILICEAEEQEEVIKSVKEVGQGDDEVLVEAAAPAGGFSQCAQEEEEEGEGVSKAGFGMGNLRVNGVGALCSFGVAAATFCILLLGGGGGGKQQQQLQKRQDHKIQIQQMYAGDERIQQVVQQVSRLNQTMSSVMGGASSARANISFGGYYQGF